MTRHPLDALVTNLHELARRDPRLLERYLEQSQFDLRHTGDRCAAATIAAAAVHEALLDSSFRAEIQHLIREVVQEALTGVPHRHGD